MSYNNERNHIYQTTIKPYRKKRLFYSPHFRKLYFEIDPEVTLCQRECQLCTHMWLQRFSVGWSPELRQTVKTLLTVRQKRIDRRDDISAK